jgi:hypothetical protein
MDESANSKQTAIEALNAIPNELRGPIAARIALLDAELAALSKRNNDAIDHLKKAAELDTTNYIPALILNRSLPTQITSIGRYEGLRSEVTRYASRNGCDSAPPLQ